MQAAPISIIGTGALGVALARSLHSNGYELFSLFNRTVSKAQKLATELGIDIHTGAFPGSKKELAPYVFLTVPDSQLAPCTRELASLSENFSGYHFVHCSGHEPSGILQSLKDKGASVAAFHPLQTFTSRSTKEIFSGIYIDIEVRHNAGFQAYLNELAENLGSNPIKITAEAKPYLHAAAVMASNYLLALLEASGKIAALGGINKEEAQQALLPLVHSTLQNANTADGAFADVLTGPIKRGDMKTVSEHLELLGDNKHLLMLYKQLGLEALELARSSGDLDNDRADTIARILKS